MLCRAKILGEIRKGRIRIDVAPGSFRLFIGSQPFTSLEREGSGEIGTRDIFASLTNCSTIPTYILTASNIGYS